MKPSTKIFHIHSIDDVYQLKREYGYTRDDYVSQGYQKMLQDQTDMIQEIVAIEERIENEMNRIRQQAEDEDGDVVFNCSKTVVTKLYDRQTDKIVFEPQFQTIERKKKPSRKIPLAEPLIYILQNELRSQKNILDKLNTKIKDMKENQLNNCVNYNKMRKDGYYGIEIHPDFSEFINTTEHTDDRFVDFFRWLSFPQLIVLNWCFETIDEELLDLSTYKI